MNKIQSSNSVEVLFLLLSVVSHDDFSVPGLIADCLIEEMQQSAIEESLEERRKRWNADPALAFTEKFGGQYLKILSIYCTFPIRMADK